MKDGFGEETPLSRWHAARLAAAAEEVGRLGHDLRGILSPALLAAERLQANPDAGVRRGAEVMVRSIDRAAAAVADTLGRLQQAIGVQRIPVVVRDAVADAVPAGLALDNRIHPELTVTLEAEHLREIVRCLLTDAAGGGATAVVASAAAPSRSLVLELICAQQLSQPPSVPGLEREIADLLARAMGGSVTRADGDAGCAATLTLRRF